MGGLIDFNTTCPWQLYLFSFIHMLGGLFMIPFDVSKLFSGVSSTESEIVMQRMMALSLLYVGGLFSMLTYHNKDKPAKITRLSNMALNAATAFLTSVVFIGNAKYAFGFERSWMHVGDMWTALILVFVLASRVSQNDAEWAQKSPLKEGLGANCKSLVLLFTVLTMCKFLALADFIDPALLMAEGLEITAFAAWTWRFITVLILEMFLAMFFHCLVLVDRRSDLPSATILQRLDGSQWQCTLDTNWSHDCSLPCCHRCWSSYRPHS
jgi:hypothetical protein